MRQEELADRLHSAAIHMLRQVATVDARSGLSPARLSALSVIVYGGPLTMTQLARAERVSPATATSTVTGLESAGLVARRRPVGDG
ncbi:MAG: MarR family transcriptional regulator, partial [Micromonosporaceae bacterium]|nr:MarR family transcriptional regulator [Micromonosporaceae bacterium]